MKISKVTELDLIGRKDLNEREKHFLATALYTMVKRNAVEFGMLPEMEYEEFIDTTFCNNNIVSNTIGVFIEKDYKTISIDGLFMLPSFPGVFGIASELRSGKQNLIKVEF